MSRFGPVFIATLNAAVSKADSGMPLLASRPAAQRGVNSLNGVCPSASFATSLAAK